MRNKLGTVVGVVYSLSQRVQNNDLITIIARPNKDSFIIHLEPGASTLMKKTTLFGAYKVVT